MNNRWKPYADVLNALEDRLKKERAELPVYPIEFVLRNQYGEHVVPREYALMLCRKAMGNEGRADEDMVDDLLDAHGGYGGPEGDLWARVK